MGMSVNLAGWYLAFRAGWGLLGLWIGIATGCTASAVVSIVLMLLVDWDKEVQATHDRLQAAVVAAACAADEVQSRLGSRVEPDFSYGSGIEGGAPSETSVASYTSVASIMEGRGLRERMAAEAAACMSMSPGTGGSYFGGSGSLPRYAPWSLPRDSFVSDETQSAGVGSV